MIEHRDWILPAYLPKSVLDYYRFRRSYEDPEISILLPKFFSSAHRILLQQETQHLQKKGFLKFERPVYICMISSLTTQLMKISIFSQKKRLWEDKSILTSSTFFLKPGYDCLTPLCVDCYTFYITSSKNQLKFLRGRQQRTKLHRLFIDS